jgi:uncharacterized protein YjbJ (UPF0337 family)
MGERIDELKGNVKAGVGKLTGDKRTEADGRGEAQSARVKRKTKGAFQKAGGSLKEGVGDVLGNEQMEAQGKADRLKGEARQSG